MRATWVQKSLANAAWDPFGTKTRPGRVRGTATTCFWVSFVTELLIQPKISLNNLKMYQNVL